MANFSSSIHHVGSREEFALMSPNPQAPSSPEDRYKSSVIPICTSTEIPEKCFCRSLAGHEDTCLCRLKLPAPLPSSYSTVAVNPLTAHAKWILTSAIVLDMKTSFQVSHAAKSSGILSHLFRTVKPNH